MTDWYDPLPSMPPSTRVTPPDVNEYRADGGSTRYLCGPCARALRAGGAALFIVGESERKCERCKNEVLELSNKRPVSVQPALL